MVNQAGQSYYKPSSSWTKRWIDIAQLKISATNEFWKLYKQDKKAYLYNSSTSAWDLKGTAAMERIAVGPKEMNTPLGL